MHDKNVTRRRFIKAGLAGGAAALFPSTFALAQSGSLLRSPKHALVIGNGRYRQAPLRNPVNDAKGMAAALKGVGFDVTLGVELTQVELRDAIRAYVDGLIKAKAVGLFYFAGHGVQLAWRNYLIPVDAEVSSVAELRERTLDVNSVIDGIRKAGNPMNIIILDACRDNPFGGAAQGIESRGLSQLDAPPATLLAYATAPGNTAADGDGEHGLYTEHLLREIGVPEASGEDVFKRVRLAVRRRSNGRQIPWESTSLEEDFWFIPPKDVRRLAEAEAEREFKQELAVWERAQNAAETAPLEDYLRRYPSGRFNELAQLRLDRVLAKQGEKRVEIVSAPQNPYSKGSARANTAYKTGDSYVWRQMDVFTRQELPRVTLTVTDITENEIVYNKGTETADLLGNHTQSALFGRRGPSQIVPLEFAVGKRWSTRFNAIDLRGQPSVVDLDLHIATREPVKVPAGSFECFRLEARGWAKGPQTDSQWEFRRWYAPERCRHYVASEGIIRNNRGGMLNSRRLELESFSES